MATIKTTIALHDGMTSALQSMNRAMNIVLNSFESMQRVSSRAIDTKSIQTARTELARAATSFNNIEREINENTAAQNRFNNSVRNGSSSAHNLWSKIKNIAIAYAGIRAVSGVIQTADQLTMTTARLNMMNDGLQTTAQLEKKIYQAAMRSRAGYAETADVIAKLGLRAGDVFKSNDETIAFAETLNKMFVIAGASQQEMASASLQLTQALGSGVLRGEEFRAVFESAPNVMQAVADYMDVPIGQLRNMASEGKITADIVKNALFAATDKVNEQFASMPYTWAQVWTTIKTYTLKATMPILKAISAITSNKKFIAFANEVGNAIRIMVGGIKMAFDVLKPILKGIYATIAAIYNFFKNNWSLIAPIVLGIAAAFVVLKAPLMAVAVWTYICTAATKAWAAAQAVFNAVMAANPITWVLLAIIALVAVFYLAIAAINKFADTSISATGIIAGAFTWLWAVLKNIFIAICNAFIGIYNIAIGVAQWTVEAWKWASENMGAIFHNIGVWWSNLWDDALIGFNNFMSWVVKKLASLAEWIDPLAGLFDIDLSGMLNASSAEYAEKSASIAANKKEYKATTAFNPDVNWRSAEYMGFADLGEAYDKGYDWGSGIVDKIGDYFSTDDLKGVMEDAQNTLDQYGIGDISDALDQSGMNDIGKALSDGLGSNPALDAIKENTDDIARNTGDMAASDEELSFMKDMAEREAINRYTLRDMTLNMTNNNNISKDADADSFLERIKKLIWDEMMSGAEGAHI